MLWIWDEGVRVQLVRPTSSDSDAVFPAAADRRSLLWLTRASRESYSVETMALCLALRLLLLPRKGE
jgi:hypothetical protein